MSVSGSWQLLAWRLWKRVPPSRPRSNSPTQFATTQAPKAANAVVDLFATRVQEALMQDVLFTVITIGFFALSIAYVHFCDRVR